jgi:DNA invertase Pin-like site-specific DNA recombinase
LRQVLIAYGGLPPLVVCSRLIASKGQDGKLLTAFTEMESGRGESADDRPERAKALAHAKLTGATLFIAQLDRLSQRTKEALAAANVRWPRVPSGRPVP